jgi:hypothetical protein
MPVPWILRAGIDHTDESVASDASSKTRAARVWRLLVLLFVT